MTPATLETPARSDDQRKAALKHANQVRIARAGFKGRLASLDRTESMVTAAEAIETVPPELATMYVVDLLKACRTIGHRRSHRILLRCDISPRKRIAGLSDRQRDELINALWDCRDEFLARGR